MITVKLTFYKYNRPLKKMSADFEILPRVGEKIFGDNYEIWTVEYIYHSLDGSPIEIVLNGDL